jgi:hypothetical protein
MAGSFMCDWCGHSIDDFSALNKLVCYGAGNREWHLHRSADGYECMQRAFEAFDEICGIERPAPARPQIDRERWEAREAEDYRARIERSRAWGRLPLSVREHSSKVKPLLDMMVARGGLERAKQPRVPGSRSFCWMYACSSKPLSPELAALERALNDDRTEA